MLAVLDQDRVKKAWVAVQRNLCSGPVAYYAQARTVLLRRELFQPLL
jgi:hypothetical protein